MKVVGTMSDTQNDDLQNAINGIVNGGEGKANDMPDFGAAPAPTTGDGAPDMELPSIPVPDPAAGLMNAEPNPIETQATPEPVKDLPDPVDGTLSETAVDTITESVEKMPVSEEMSEMKRNMIKDLIPLMDKVSLDPEKQSGLYKEVIDATHDKDLVAGAYNAAKKISDDKERAEALLYLINETE